MGYHTARVKNKCVFNGALQGNQYCPEYKPSAMKWKSEPVPCAVNLHATTIIPLKWLLESGLRKTEDTLAATTGRHWLQQLNHSTGLALHLWLTQLSKSFERADAVEIFQLYCLDKNWSQARSEWGMVVLSFHIQKLEATIHPQELVLYSAVVCALANLRGQEAQVRRGQWNIIQFPYVERTCRIESKFLKKKPVLL